MVPTNEAAVRLLDVSAVKAGKSAKILLFVGFIAGLVIAMSGVISNTVACAAQGTAVQRLLTGAVFATGLPIVTLMGGELFTGNCLMITGVFARRISIRAMLRNLAIVYIGNIAGSVFVAVCIIFAGQLNLYDGGLAAFTIKAAATRMSIPFSSAIFSGLLCNILVCFGVFMASTAKSVPGKVLASYIPVFVFVTSGLEHSVANVYFCVVALLAKLNPDYLAKAVDVGADIAKLNWVNFLAGHLLPVTIGNLIGGCFIAGFYIWYCYSREAD